MSTLPAGIKHVVVLMLENRSFDHILGGLQGVEGPAGRVNIDPNDGKPLAVSFDAESYSPAVPDPANAKEFIGDPSHDFLSVNEQLFEQASPIPGAPVTCGGFIRSARMSTDPASNVVAREVLRCFNTPNELVTFAALAANFTVCDHWFSSVPGPTWPNRLFVHAATSFGTIDNQFRLFDGRTIYDCIGEAGLDWAIYYHDLPQSFCLNALRERRDHSQRQCMRPIAEFYADVQTHRQDSPSANTLPSYVFIEPGYFEPPTTLLGRFEDWLFAIGRICGLPLRPPSRRANDQHAPHDVRLGEHLIADVYDALRSNEDVWQHCLFIVLHDEHGGIFDHVLPPPATPPDPRGSTDPPFMFDRLGLRVPAILVSPYVAAGVESTPYEHASIVQTVREHFAPTAAPLTPRDAAATPLRKGVFLGSPRQDAPTRITRPPATLFLRGNGNPAARKMNDLQQHLMELATAGEPATSPAPGANGVQVQPGTSPAVGPTTPIPTTEADGYAVAKARMALHRAQR